jgi:hypothetical protein
MLSLFIDQSDVTNLCLFDGPLKLHSSAYILLPYVLSYS